MFRRKSKKIIYLDHAAATPLDARVFGAMRPFLIAEFGNPSSLHHKGMAVRSAVESSRKLISGLIGARSEEIVFTSGGTESCNLALLGLARMNTNKKTNNHKYHPHIITTSIEHHAVLEPIKCLQKNGWKVAFLPVDRHGFVKADDVKKAIRKETVLVSVMYANNEIGSIQPIVEIGRVIRAQNEKRKTQNLSEIVFHTDACQAAGILDLNVNRLGVDLMSVSASKIHGPKGVGFLYVRKGLNIVPIIHGGGQERGLRPGTENAAGIVGMAKALELAVKEQDRDNRRLIGLRDYLIRGIRKEIPKAILNGPERYKKLKKPIPPFFDGRQKMGVWRLPNNINITIPGMGGEALMLYLDAAGICVSTGSACTTGSTEASHVLTAIGLSSKLAKESIRITLGRETNKANLDYLIRALKHSISLLH